MGHRARVHEASPPATSVTVIFRLEFWEAEERFWCQAWPPASWQTAEWRQVVLGERCRKVIAVKRPVCHKPCSCLTELVSALPFLKRKQTFLSPTRGPGCQAKIPWAGQTGVTLKNSLNSSIGDSLSPKLQKKSKKTHNGTLVSMNSPWSPVVDIGKLNTCA